MPSAGGGLYGGGGMGYTSPQSTEPQQGGINLKVAAGAIVALLLILALVWFFTQKASSQQQNIQSQSPQNPQIPQIPQIPQNTVAPYAYDPDRMETRAPDSKLTSFGFESLLYPGYVPDLNAKLIPKPAANPVYALVNCGVANTRYAIRWRNKFLTVVTGDIVQWSDLKQEPNSCFQLVPGWCKTDKGDEYVMLRSQVNGNFLRADTDTSLVCKDAPTGNTALNYCWKLRGPVLPSEIDVGQCGCQYDANVRAVVCKPCTSATSAAPATPAPLPGPWPELIGWDVRQAQAFLSRQYPGIAVYALACPTASSCPVNIAPTHPGPWVILRYNTQTNRIIFPPAAERMTAPPQQQPIALRV